MRSINPDFPFRPACAMTTSKLRSKSFLVNLSFGFNISNLSGSILFSIFAIQKQRQCKNAFINIIKSLDFFFSFFFDEPNCRNLFLNKNKREEKYGRINYSMSVSVHAKRLLILSTETIKKQ